MLKFPESDGSQIQRGSRLSGRTEKCHPLGMTDVILMAFENRVLGVLLKSATHVAKSVHEDFCSGRAITGRVTGNLTQATQFLDQVGEKFSLASHWNKMTYRLRISNGTTVA